MMSSNVVLGPYITSVYFRQTTPRGSLERNYFTQLHVGLQRQKLIAFDLNVEERRVEKSLTRYRNRIDKACAKAVEQNNNPMLKYRYLHLLCLLWSLRFVYV